MQSRLGYAHEPQDDTRRNNWSNFNEIGEKLCKLQWSSHFVKKITVWTFFGAKIDKTLIGHGKITNCDYLTINEVTIRTEVLKQIY